MAAPSYGEDLTDIDLAEVGSTGVAINFSGGGGGAPAFGADLGMQGNGAWDRPVTAAERGILFNQTPGAPVVAAGVHIYQWLFVATPGITDLFNNRGAYVIAGTGTGALVQFLVEGSDTYGAAGRVGKCYPFRYNSTAATNLRVLTGSPGATPTYFGAGMKTIATAKGSNLGVDAVRYGTGAYLTAGELISAGDASDIPCTFTGFNTQNDAIANRWGILTSAGGSFELQGRFVIGQDNTKAATLCRFRDSDVSILIPDNLHCEATFNQFIFDHASTRAEWTNINITSECVLSPGDIVVNAANPTVIVTGGTWTNIGTTTLRSNTTVDGATWRNAGQITTNGASIDNSLIDKNTAAAAIIGSLSELTGNTFISDGTGYAVDIGTIAASTTLTWNNNDSGYAAVDGSTGNETIKVNYTDTGTPLTINVAAGASTPTVHNSGAGTVNVVSGLTTITIDAGVTLVGAEVRIYDLDNTPAGSLGTELSGTESHNAATYQYTGTASNLIWIQIFKTGYEEFGQSLTIPSASATFDAILVADTNS